MKVDLITSELIVQARAALQRFIEGKGRLCIPAHPTDDDMLLSEALDRLQVLSDPGHVLVALASSDAPRWIPVTQEPPEGGRYLVCGVSAYRDDTVYALADYALGWSHDWVTPVELREITHWMPLPALPQGDKETE